MSRSFCLSEPQFLRLENGDKIVEQLVERILRGNIPKSLSKCPRYVHYDYYSLATGKIQVITGNHPPPNSVQNKQDVLGVYQITGSELMAAERGKGGERHMPGFMAGQSGT